MKMKALAAVLCLTFVASALPAAAETYTGSDGWNVSFTGDKMVSNFKTSQMDEAISALQPGDSVTFSVALGNDGSYTTDWYMTNTVLKTLEESQSVADGGAYTYVLTYTGPSGAVDTLYSSDSIGGDKTAGKDLEGLHEATDSLQDFFFLDELTSGQNGHVDLVVALDGETQGNIYQDTLAALQMNFAVETVSVSTTSPTPTPSTTTTTTGTPGRSAAPKPGRVYKSHLPQTGDTLPIMLLSAVCGLSGLVLMLLSVLRLRKEHKK